jgi:hypothetical protein
MLLSGGDVFSKIFQKFQTGTVSFNCLFFFLILICETIGTAATPGLLCQPRVIMNMIVEK